MWPAGQARYIGSVYIGSDARHGDTSFGDLLHPPAHTPHAERPRLHRESADAYWQRIADPANSSLLERVRGELRGRFLACHCVARPCVEADGAQARTCLPCHGHCLAALANCTSRQLDQALAALRSAPSAVEATCHG